MSKKKKYMTLQIDTKEIEEYVLKYIKRKVQKELKDVVEEEISDIYVNSGNIEIKIKDNDKDIEKIVDWIKENFPDKPIFL